MFSVDREGRRLQMSKLTSFQVSVILKAHPLNPKPNHHCTIWLLTRTHTHTYIVDHEVHDGLRHQVSDGLVDDADVGVHQVTDCFNLPL